MRRMLVVVGTRGCRGGNRLTSVADSLGTPTLLDSPLSPVHATVPPILDCIVASVAQSSCNLGPSLAHLLYQLFDHFTFLSGDGFMI